MSMTPVVIIVQARMGSSRLPGKVLKTVLHKSLLAYLVERLKRTKRSDRIVVATTDSVLDDPIVTECLHLGIECFRGSESNVLERYYLCAKKFNARTVVRITADCPLIAPELIDQALEFYDEHPEYGFVTNSPSEGESRTFPRGMDIEVFSYKALEEAHQNATLPQEREHVTPYMRSRPHHYRMHYLHLDRNLGDWRLTVDTPEDFALIQKIIESIYPGNPEFDFAALCKCIDQNREWLLLNRGVRQKTV